MGKIKKQTKNVAADTIVIDVVSKVRLEKLENCNACGQDHENIEFTKLAEPFKFADVEWNYSAFCPTNDMEIVLNFEDEPQGTEQEASANTPENQASGENG